MDQGLSVYDPPDLNNIENVEEYRHGGFHPVRLQDTFKNGQYRVIHKLGHGRSATVWLAKDTTRQGYVALKIISAELSENCHELMILELLKKNRDTHPGQNYVTSLLGSFRVKGPNGMHVCLVLKVGVPVKPAWLKLELAQKTQSTQRMALQVAQGLSYLHSCGLAHGDLTTSNLLLQIDSLDMLTEAEVLQVVPPPLQENLLLANGLAPGPSAPEYVVEPADLTSLIGMRATWRVCLMDFGQSFDLTAPPVAGVGTPFAFCAPKLLHNGSPSAASDVWALACVIFELRAGYPLFEDYGGSKETVIKEIVQSLGKLPEPWWNAWKSRDKYFDDDGLPHKQWQTPFALAETITLRDHVANVIDGDGNGDGGSVENEASKENGDRALVGELEMLHELSSLVLRYSPEERLSADEICELRWMKSQV